ncbi:uncharacterized protein [Periplaneta americana]|uniref:uncharacterized protein isoform X2 n=1 Tax=Periplaneta americana TaxID=6978 RepID=UPI0037E8C113
MVRYTIEQRICLVESYLRTKKSLKRVEKCICKFRHKYPESPVPTKSYVHALIRKLRNTGSVLNEKKVRRRSVLTKEKLADIQAKLQLSPRKSLRRLSQEVGISYTSAQRATKVLQRYNVAPTVGIKKKEKRNGPANKQKGAAENDTSTEIGKEVDENETEFVADQAQMTVSRSSQDTTVCTSVCKTEMHTLGEISIKTELTDETHTESKNCVLGI